MLVLKSVASNTSGSAGSLLDPESSLRLLLPRTMKKNQTMKSVQIEGEEGLSGKDRSWKCSGPSLGRHSPYDIFSFGLPSRNSSAGGTSISPSLDRRASLANLLAAATAVRAGWDFIDRASALGGLRAWRQSTFTTCDPGKYVQM